MIRFVKFTFLLLITSLLACRDAKLVQSTTTPAWTLGGFHRPEGINPIISPDSTTSFLDPMSGKQVRWEENDTFNPGAVVKDDTLFVLYRAEDKFGIGIGFRTSRLGLASSTDGLHFNRSKEPVLYPAEDGQKKYNGQVE